MNDFKYMARIMFLNEVTKKIGNIKVQTNMSSVGTSLVYEFSSAEDKIVKKFLDKNNLSPEKMPSSDYTDEVIIIYKGKAFSLYARDGRFRVGAGGNNTSEKKLVTRDYINDFLQEIKWKNQNLDKL